MNGKWSANAWWLERRNPREWGKQEKRDVNVTHESQVPFDMNHLEDLYRRKKEKEELDKK